MSLTACETIQVITTECSWAASIEFSQETKEWLGGLDWPNAAFDDFKKIGDHNELFKKNC